MRAEIISVGTELLLGDIVNTNAQFLSRHLAALGYSVFYQTTVGDNAGRLRQLVYDAKARSDVLIFTGGLGPTDDDLTKQTVAEAFDDRLVQDVDELVRLEQFFKKRGLAMTANNKKQALVPKNGRKIPNDNGTAPGALFRQGGRFAILLPGPPREMQPMFLEQVLPLLQAMQDASIRSVTLHTYGIGESALEVKVHTLLESENPTAALYAKTGEVHIRITARAATAEQAEVMCDEYAALFRKVLGDLIYSEDGADLPEVTVRHLLQNDLTVATAESCTGGLLGEKITAVPGASAIYGYGAITYANAAKHDMVRVRNATLRRWGAVSGQVAAEMAFGAAQKGDADFGVGITGIAGPGGGAGQPAGLVYVAVSLGREVVLRKLDIPGRGRDYVREIACLNALDMVRRLTLKLPVPDVKVFRKNQVADYEREGRPQKRGGPLARGLWAALAVAALFVLLLLGLNLSRRFGAASSAPSGVLPSAQGLRYGTEEYTAAACALVAEQNAQNAAVAALVAMPGFTVETLVAQTAHGTQQALAGAAQEPGVNGLPVMAAAAVPGAAQAHVLLLGGGAFQPLLSYQENNGVASLSTFTCYTARGAQVYRVFAAYVADGGGASGRFEPACEGFPDYGAFLDYFLGVKARSLYDIPLDAQPEDSFMTLAVEDTAAPGRLFYLCGRLVRPGEAPAQGSTAAAAGSPLMPAAWYEQQDAARPGEEELYALWLRWYMARDVTNSRLQLAAGMPAGDAGPLLMPPAQPVSSSVSSASSAPSSSSSSSAPSSSSASSAAAAGANLSGQVSSASESSPGGSSGAGTPLGEGEASSSLPPGGGAESGGEAPSSSVLRPLPPLQPQKPDPAYLRVTLNGARVTLPTAEVLAQICQVEAAAAEPAAIQAVAVAAHSWILNRQGTGDEAPAVAGRPPSARVLEAVRPVAGLVLSADGEAPAFSPWFSMAAAATTSAGDAFGGTRSYLSSVPSPHEQGQDGWRQIIAVPAAVVAEAALARLGVDLQAMADVPSWLAVLEKDDGGYVTTLRVGDAEVSGFSFWQDILLQNGAPLLNSPAFEIEYNGEDFVFICYGQGHGCGMSLAGAAGYAAAGWQYDSILAHYFPGCGLIAW